MNALSSEYCISDDGCESGWTLYLKEEEDEEKHSINNAASASKYRSPATGSHHYINGGGGECYYEQEKNEEDEDDLSMVSDASSGPPHFSHQYCSYLNAQKHCYSESINKEEVAKRSNKRQKVKENYKHPVVEVEEEQEHDHHHHLPSYLDDTASSPLFDFSTNNVTVSNQQTSTESMLDYSQGFSATYFEERSSLQHQFGFLQPSLSITK